MSRSGPLWLSCCEAPVKGYGSIARLLKGSMVAQADLILTATREHRAAVVEDSPAALRRTFSVRVFARLAAQVDRARLGEAAGVDASAGERLAALVPLEAGYRSQVSADLDDVVDPYLRNEGVYLESLSQICEAVGDDRTGRVGAAAGEAVGAPAGHRDVW